VRVMRTLPTHPLRFKGGVQLVSCDRFRFKERPRGAPRAIKRNGAPKWGAD